MLFKNPIDNETQNVNAITYLQQLKNSPLKMGCQSSDIASFANALEAESNNGHENQSQQQQQNRPRPQQATAQAPPPQGGKIEQASEKVLAVAVPGKKKKSQLPRQVLEKKAQLKDDFLTHHLKYELSLSKFSSKSRIKRRQILEHIVLQNYWGNIGGKGINSMAYFESAQSAWMQRTFLDIWEVAHDEFFNQGVEERQVRRKLAEQYMFEIYELKEYVDAGLGNINAFCEKTRCALYEFMQSSDDGLFNIFKRLKDRYPQTGQTEKIEFPDVPSTKTNMNLLENFPSKAYVDPPHINLQTIYEDISLLLKQAVKLQDVFKEDMKEMLGSDALACPKVTQIFRDGVPEFNACAVRRVFIKWAENLLELCPDLQMSKPFLKFIKAKADIANNFFFKSTVQKSTHKIVIDTICYLIEVAKYNLKDQSRRKEFLFNIYDLLRCKVKRNNPQQIVELLKKMESTKITKNGQKFEVLRVKNRFKTNNRDLLINFRYGDILVGEAQLCIDDANVSKVAKHNYEFCHYIYELERSLFGPSLELMMQYEDFERPDISVNFQAEDTVDKRENMLVKLAQPTKRLCLQGHQMISLVGNYFLGDDVEAVLPASCNFCDRITNTGIKYDYCFHCNCYLCRDCLKEYEKYEAKKNWLCVQRDDVAAKITDQQRLTAECNNQKSLLVLFYQDGSSSSQLFKDSLVYHQSKLLMQPGKFIPKIAIANIADPGVKAICNSLKITQYPTFILFNKQAQPIRTLIGYSWLEVPFFYETQKRLLEGASIEIDLICAGCAGEENSLQFSQTAEMEGNLFCLNCFNTNKPINMPQNYQALGALCSNGHYRCIACSYAALDIPSTYKDPTGETYLSEPVVAPKIKKCPKGHNPTFTKKNTLGVWEFQCYGCNKKTFFDDEHGVAVCEQCKTGLCSKCMGFKELNLEELDAKNDLAVHYVESTAEEGTLCVCQRHFKKCYKTRYLTMEELVSEHQNKKWKCSLCQKHGTEGDLHIGCFNCPSLGEAIGQKTNFEICIKCATKSQLLMREAQVKVKEEGSFFVCPKKHQMVKTSLAYDQQLTFDCMYCKRKFFGNTERIHCKTCKTNCCDDCVENLCNANPPRCKQYCKNKHTLTLYYKVKTLKFCDGCMKVLRQEHFSCAEGCSYELCLDCSNKSPGFIGNALQDLYNGFKSTSDEIEFEEEEEVDFNNLLNNDEEEEQEDNESLDMAAEFDDFQ